MLVLIGLGICDENDISVKGLNELKECEFAFAENYTNVMKHGTLKALEKMSGKKIVSLEREAVEGEKLLLESAKKGKTALLVPGDPLIATTHTSLLMAAKKHKIKTKVIHSSSIFTAAIGESGLHAYKFGKTATLSYWTDAYKPTTPYKIVSENKSRGLHTMLLLDINNEKGPMKAGYALELLSKIESELNGNVFTPSTLLVVMGMVGYDEQKITFGTLEKLLSHKQKLGSPPFVILVPGELHFSEKDYLENFEL